MRRHTLGLLGASAAGVVGACSLMAPSDAQLSGSDSNTERAVHDAGSGEAGAAAAADAGSAGETGEGGEPAIGGEDSGDGSLVPFPGSNSAGATSSGATASSPPGPLLWLKADAGITEKSGFVTVWADQSKHALNATQPLDGHQPKRVTPIAGKLSLLEFDGVDDYLALPQGFSSFEGGLSLFIAAQETVVAACPALIHLSNAPDVDDIDLDFDSVRGAQTTPSKGTGESSGAGDLGRTFHFEVGAKYLTAPSDSFSPGTLITLSVVLGTDGKVELRLGGLLLAMGTIPLPSSVERMNNFIGRSLYSGCKPYHGRIGELMLYDRALPPGERLGIEQYLSERWQ
jgi:hypothetical protein